MKQTVETNEISYEVTLFLRKEPDFREKESGEFIEQGNFPSGFDKIEEPYYVKASNDELASDKAFGLDQDNGKHRSLSVGDVVRVNTIASEKFYIVASIGFDEFDPVEGKFF